MLTLKKIDGTVPVPCCYGAREEERWVEGKDCIFFFFGIERSFDCPAENTDESGSRRHLSGSHRRAFGFIPLIALIAAIPLCRSPAPGYFDLASNRPSRIKHTAMRINQTGWGGGGGAAAHLCSWHGPAISAHFLTN